MAPALYDRYFIQKQDERRGLFELVAQRFEAQSGIYPGSFVHITPAFYIPEMAFLDSDSRMDKFFGNAQTMAYIEEQKEYTDPPNVVWKRADYASAQGLAEHHYDVMFSFYAGFISRDCKKYLRSGGILIANNSHGDASIALVDPDYEVIGIILRSGDRFRLKTEALTDYITKKDGTEIDREKVRSRMVGERFARPAYAYVFRKVA